MELELHERLFNYQQAYPEYYEIRIISPEGKELLRSVLRKDGNHTTDESSIRYIMQASSEPGITYTTFYRNPDNNQPVLLASKPLRFYPKDSISKASQLHLYGYLMLTVDLNFLKSQVKNAKIGKLGIMFITDSSGTILFDPKESRVGKQLPPEMFHSLKNGIESGVPIEADYEKQPAYYQGIKLHDWLYVFTVFPDKELTSKRVMLGKSVALITLVAVLLTTSLLFVILKVLLIRRIQQLNLAAREMGRGQMLVPVDASSSDEIGDLAKTFQEMGENLDHYHEQVNYVAYHDSLTGLPNRMMFSEYLKRATAEARSNGQELSVLFLDMDNFKRVNDTLGHLVGDRVLKEVAHRIATSVRDKDLIGRYGGEEFLLIFPETSLQVAQQVAERIRQHVGGTPIHLPEHSIPITISIGLTPLNADDTLESLLQRADSAMYAAKQAGRNCIAVA